MIRFLKELYLTGFTLGFRFRIAGGWGRWVPSLGPIMDAGKGVFFVWVIMFLILEGIKSYIEIHVGTQVNSPWEFAAVMALYFANHYILVTRGHGIKFEREFDNLEKNRKNLLLASCGVMGLATIAFSIYLGFAYQRFFHL